MVESYKFKSKLANVLVFVAGLIAYVGVDGLKTVIPVKYANLVPIIVLIAGYIVVQGTENKRVEVAEELVHEEYSPQAITGEDRVLNDEYETGDGQ